MAHECSHLRQGQVRKCLSRRRSGLLRRPGGELEYDFVVAPGADPSAIALGIEAKASGRRSRNSQQVLGSGQAQIDPKGTWSFRSRAATCSFTNRSFTKSRVRCRGPKSEVQEADPIDSKQSTPIANRQIDKFVEGHYALDAQNHVRFELGPYDHTRPLVIDPVLAYATYVGGSGGDIGYAIAVDSRSTLTSRGSRILPISPPRGTPYQSSYKGNGDCFVAKINSAGTAAYLFHLSWRQPIRHRHGHCRELRKRLHHRLHQFCGLPRQGAGGHWHDVPFQQTYGGNTDAFVAQLDTTGSTLWSTPRIWAAAAPTSVRESPSIPPAMPMLRARPSQRTFPSRANPLQSNINGSQDAFVTKVNFTGEALVYSTYLGGSEADVAQGIQLDSCRKCLHYGLHLLADFPHRLQPLSRRPSGAERMPLWPNSTLRARP